MADERALSNLRKRRGVVRSSITRLGSRLKNLEDSPDGPGTGDHAKQLATKLDTLDAEFKALHLQLIDQISADEVGELDREQVRWTNMMTTSLLLRFVYSSLSRNPVVLPPLEVARPHHVSSCAWNGTSTPLRKLWQPCQSTMRTSPSWSSIVNS